MKYKILSLLLFFANLSGSAEHYCITNRLGDTFCGQLVYLDDNLISLVTSDGLGSVEKSFFKDTIVELAFSDEESFVYLSGLRNEWSSSDLIFLMEAFEKRVLFWTYLKHSDKEMFIDLVIQLVETGDYVQAFKTAQILLDLENLNEFRAGFILCVLTALVETSQYELAYGLKEEAKLYQDFKFNDLVYWYLEAKFFLEKNDYLNARRTSLYPICMNVRVDHRYCKELYLIAIQATSYDGATREELLLANRLYEEFLDIGFQWPDEQINPQQKIDYYDLQKKYYNCSEYD